MSRRQCRPLKVFQSTLPARGATAPAGCSGGSGWYFNPRSPHGERPTSSWAMAAHKRFQSTLPARGATGQAAAYFRDDRISIHAPRTGSDEKCLRTGTTTLLFQSTLPARGATTPKNILRRITPYFNPRSPHGERPKHGSTRIPGEDISIHAPCTGSDTERDTLKQQLDISIHAPCTGSDIFICPCPLYKPISIHAPCTGSDATLPHAYRQPRFQSTLPARGATFHELVVVQFVKFQSTLPARGATSPADGWQLPARISIHAPCTGSDAQLVRADGHLTISIHAPCTGSDWYKCTNAECESNFNPRSLHGERLC